MLEIADNILKYRHERNITQGDLADFLGVTKASVSKWETRQSYPDIMLLPRIAAFFNITVDELLGYKSQLNKKQVNKIYTKIAKDFSSKPFEDVVNELHSLAKEYYSCFYMIVQIVALVINHFMLTPDKDKQQELLEWAIRLSEHVCKECDDMGIKRQGIISKALCNLQLGRTENVIEELQPFFDPDRLSVISDSILVKAYEMSGDLDNADLFSQLSIYTSLIELISNSINHLGLHLNNFEIGIKTLRRTEAVIDTYEIYKLNENTTLQFYYQAAAFYCIHGKIDEALEYLKRYVDGGIEFVNGGIRIHGDDYFDRIDKWYKETCDNPIPRDEKVIRDSLLPSIQVPVFKSIYDNAAYKRLVKKLMGG